jgi:hypothetical protein
MVHLKNIELVNIPKYPTSQHVLNYSYESYERTFLSFLLEVVFTTKETISYIPKAKKNEK